MLDILNSGCLLISSVSLFVAVRGRRKEALLRREIETLAEQLRSLSSQLENQATHGESAEVVRMRHDVLTPLNTVMGFCALLRETSSGWSPKQERMLHNINDGARQILELVDVASKSDQQP